MEILCDLKVRQYHYYINCDTRLRYWTYLYQDMTYVRVFTFPGFDGYSMVMSFSGFTQFTIFLYLPLLT